MHNYNGFTLEYFINSTLKLTMHTNRRFTVVETCTNVGHSPWSVKLNTSTPEDDSGFMIVADGHLGDNHGYSF